MTPLPDRIVLLLLAGTVGVCFLLAALVARQGGEPPLPMLWKDGGADAPPLTRLHSRPTAV
ncbi:hypothetical protein EVJ50_03680 [Synechococcus sp. RSCCF101]|uniref:hypothetical protein n=1 Tax=Synechococcus sp. RSCCF101 TaxID=2511069 RepID=UPI0012492B9E|nr:hypothetical protein [Synechococcus sp. RSCCF101]QEY31484.1 hypothetical protein EVJ50_03680 [Synechococcus sp. RSCCF101]